MVGSSIGWTQAPYVACPAVPAGIIDACVPLRGGRVQVIPGIACENRLGAPDFMRGEETQILGALALEPRASARADICCVFPARTPSGWCSRMGSIEEFLTRADRRIIWRTARSQRAGARTACAREDVIGGAAFEAGLERCGESPQVPVLHRLFECRSRLLGGELTPAGRRRLSVGPADRQRCRRRTALVCRLPSRSGPCT